MCCAFLFKWQMCSSQLIFLYANYLIGDGLFQVAALSNGIFDRSLVMILPLLRFCLLLELLYIVICPLRRLAGEFQSNE